MISEKALTISNKRWEFISRNGIIVFLFLLVIALFLIGEILSKGFLEYRHIGAILRTASFLGIAAIGQTLVILTGGIDLSIGPLITMGNVFICMFMNGIDANNIWAFTAIILLGLAFGAINGLGVTFLRISPLVMTLAVGSLITGFTLIFSQGAPKGLASPLLRQIGVGYFFNSTPNIVIIWLIFSVAVIVLLNFSVFGRKLIYVGANAKAASLSGIRVSLIKIIAYAVSGVAAVLAGAFMAGYTQTAFLGIGNEYIMWSITAVVIGGTSLSGGKGGYIGTIAGANYSCANGKLINFGSCSRSRTQDSQWSYYFDHDNNLLQKTEKKIIQKYYYEDMMNNFKVVFTDYYYPNNSRELEILKQIDGIKIVDLTKLFPGGVKDEDQLVEYVADADALIVQFARISRSLIEALKNCKIISRYAIGVDTIDVECAHEKGIVVANVPDYCIEEVSDTAIAHIFNCVRKVTLSNNLLHEGKFSYQKIQPIKRIRNHTIGLIAFGHIARRVADKMRPFGNSILAYDPYFMEKDDYPWVEFVNLNELLTRSDIISVHAPLNKDTRFMVNEERLALLKPGSIIVNTSRGGVIDEKALAGAIEDGRVAAAGLDVLDYSDEMYSNSVLSKYPDKVFITPHMGWYSEEAISDLQCKTAMNVYEMLVHGKPLYQV
jgi:D-3-phosphoglycerate dehydrogenase / 2-oxoglutarate reductase